MSDLRDWLSQYGSLTGPILEATLQTFQNEEILEVDDVVSLSGPELETLGIKLGTRKKILDGISRYSNQKAPLIRVESAQSLPPPPVSSSSPVNSDADVPSETIVTPRAPIKVSSLLLTSDLSSMHLTLRLLSPDTFLCLSYSHFLDQVLEDIAKLSKKIHQFLW